MKLPRLEQLQELLKDEPDDPFLLFAIAQEYLKEHKNDEALNYFLQLLNEQPNYTATYYHLGKLYETLQEDQMAMETYKKGMDLTLKIGEIHEYDELRNALSMIADEQDEEK